MTQTAGANARQGGALCAPCPARLARAVSSSAPRVVAGPSHPQPRRPPATGGPSWGRPRARRRPRRLPARAARGRRRRARFCEPPRAAPGPRRRRGAPRPAHRAPAKHDAPGMPPARRRARTLASESPARACGPPSQRPNSGAAAVGNPKPRARAHVRPSPGRARARARRGAPQSPAAFVCPGVARLAALGPRRPLSAWRAARIRNGNRDSSLPAPMRLGRAEQRLCGSAGAPRAPPPPAPGICPLTEPYRAPRARRPRIGGRGAPRARGASALESPGPARRPCRGA